MPTALVTGATGFAGSHLVELLLREPELEVAAQVRIGREHSVARHPRLTTHIADLLDQGATERLIAAVAPDFVFHLVGQASPAVSLREPAGTFEANIVTQLHVLEAVRAAGSEARVLVVGSGDEYGLIRPEELPVAEDQPFRPTSPYAVSKVAQDLLGYQAFVAHGVQAIRVRPFNHIGPRQSDHFVASAFARQIARIELARQEPVIRVGNLEARRDFTDVRDVVRAYWLALRLGTPGAVYNVGSGRSVPVRHILDLLVSRCRVRVEVVVDPERLRPADTPDVVCDARKLREMTGWRPAIEPETTIQDLLNYWREREGG